MGKQKKISDKLRLYYRGCIAKPTRIADENDMKIIAQALEECLPKRSQSTFMVQAEEKLIRLRIVMGLKAGLRSLKQQTTKALIYDDTASKHLTKFLIELGHKLNIPVVQAHRLVELKPIAHLNTTSLVISLVDFDQSISEKSEVVYKDKDPRPKSLEDSIECEKFQKLFDLLQQYKNSPIETLGLVKKTNIEFRLPILSQEVANPEIRQKKEIKKEKKLALKKANKEKKANKTKT